MPDLVRHERGLIVDEQDTFAAWLASQPTFAATQARSAGDASVGAALYALVYPFMAPLISLTNYGEITLASVFHVTNGIWIAIPFSAILLLLVFKVLKDRYE